MEVQKTKVTRVIHEWSKYANITFKFVDDLTAATVRITFFPERGSFSYIGTEISRLTILEPSMNIARISGDSDVLTAEETGIILHELGHTLGMVHEHKSSGRGGQIKLSTSGNYPSATESSWTHFMMDSRPGILCECVRMV